MYNFFNVKYFCFVFVDILTHVWRESLCLQKKMALVAGPVGALAENRPVRQASYLM